MNVRGRWQSQNFVIVIGRWQLQLSYHHWTVTFNQSGQRYWSLSFENLVIGIGHWYSEKLVIVIGRWHSKNRAALAVISHKNVWSWTESVNNQNVLDFWEKDWTVAAWSVICQYPKIGASNMWSNSRTASAGRYACANLVIKIVLWCSKYRKHSSFNRINKRYNIGWDYIVNFVLLRLKICLKRISILKLLVKETVGRYAILGLFLLKGLKNTC